MRFCKIIFFFQFQASFFFCWSHFLPKWRKNHSDILPNWSCVFWRYYVWQMDELILRGNSNICALTLNVFSFKQTGIIVFNDCLQLTSSLHWIITSLRIFTVRSIKALKQGWRVLIFKSTCKDWKHIFKPPECNLNPDVVCVHLHLKNIQ